MTYEVVVGSPFAAGLGINFGGLNSFSMNESTDQLEFIFQAEEPITITRLGLRVTTITSSPTYRYSLQGVDASGNPDGTVKGGGSPASVTFNPTSLGWSTGTFQWLTLDNSYACSRGEMLAAVIDYSSGTIGASNLSSFGANANGTGDGLPYPITNNAGSRTRATAFPYFGYGSSTTAYGFPLVNRSGSAYSTSGTPEAGIKFTLPAGWGDTFEVVGAIMSASVASAGSGTLRLYSGGGASDTTPLQSVTVDFDHYPAVSVRPRTMMFDEATLSTLSFGSTYRVSLEAAGTQSFTFADELTTESAADMDAFPLGQNVMLTTRNGGNWTDTDTRRPTMALIVRGITEPTGGGGGIIYRRPLVVGA